MHRAISRAIRGQCRKFRDNDCPVAAGEEVRRNQKDEESKNGFVPPKKYSLEEAVTWTTGFVLAYQLTHHGHRRRALIEECPPAASLASTSGCALNCETPEKRKISCPFSLASKVLSQPIFTSPAPSTLNVCQRKASSISTSAVISSIDVTPFIHDDAQESELPVHDSNAVEDDDIVFGYEMEATKTVELIDGIPNNPEEYGRTFGADLLSVLGAFEFLQAESKAKAKSSSELKELELPSMSRRRANSASGRSRRKARCDGESPIQAVELMKRGAELGSIRALFNVGVAYERMNDLQMAKEYYKRAADLGHPLGTYNSAVFALRDGHLTEGYALMKTASDFGVPEAKEFLKPGSSGNSMALKLEVGQV